MKEYWVNVYEWTYPSDNLYIEAYYAHTSKDEAIINACNDSLKYRIHVKMKPPKYEPVEVSKAEVNEAFDRFFQR